MSRGIPVNAIKIDNTVNSLFKIAQKERIEVSHFCLLPVLLLAYKDAVEANLTREGADLSVVFELNRISFLKENPVLLEGFYQSLLQYNNEALEEIYEVLVSLDKEFMDRFFYKIFEELLVKIANKQTKWAGEFIQPASITRLVCHLTDIQKATHIFNPFAGVASFGIHLRADQKYCGQEVDRTAWLLGNLRLFVHGKTENTTYRCEDSIGNWPSDQEKFDCIVGYPPLGKRLSEQDKEVDFTGKTVEYFFLKKGIDSLTSDGKLVAILPQSFLIRSGHDQRFRENLLKDDLIDTIVYLPEQIFYHTNIPFCIVVLNKNKQHANKIRLIDTKAFESTLKTREKTLNVSMLLTHLEQEKTDKNIVRFVEAQDIIANDYNLNGARYFMDDAIAVLKEKETACQLSDILEVVAGEKVKAITRGKVVKNSELKDDNMDFVLDLSTISEQEVSVHNFRKIEESCLLIATTWSTFKPTYFNYTGEAIYVPNYISCFKFDKAIVDITYLINELKTNVVVQQINAISQGGALHGFKVKDFLTVYINLLPLVEQQAKAEGIFQSWQEMNNLKRRNVFLARSIHKAYYADVKSINHNLGIAKQNILDNSSNLLNYLATKKDKIKNLNKELLLSGEIDILTALKRIKEDIGFISEVLKRGESGFDLYGDYQKILIQPSEVKSLVNSYSGIQMNYNVVIEPFDSSECDMKGIYADKVFLKVLIDNILSNANEHGFDKKEESNEVVIALKDIGNYLVLEIKNNGKPFPKEVVREGFITKYAKTIGTDQGDGKGLGGYDIHRIATFFGNENWELDLNKDSEYPVNFTFYFKMLQVNCHKTEVLNY